MPRAVSFIHPYYFSSIKRSFDVALAVALLVGLSPLLIFLSLLVWLTSGRPFFFTQRRVGWRGQIFTLYKFRTMKVGAEKLRAQLLAQNEAPAPMFKLHYDPRFVGIGRWLSNTGLDELPQLLNILRGEMSFIGPRPLPVKEARQLLRLHPTWKFRQAVRPGILSEWALDASRHQSLKQWQKLETLTVKKGGVRYELGLVLIGIKMIGRWIMRSGWEKFKK